jgi:hypothetical protein
MESLSVCTLCSSGTWDQASVRGGVGTQAGWDLDSGDDEESGPRRKAQGSWIDRQSSGSSPAQPSFIRVLSPLGAESQENPA